MRPLLHDPPVAHHEDLVTIANRAEPVGDDDAGASPAPEIVVNRLFDDRIQRRGGLVEDDHGRIARQRSRAISSRRRWPPLKFLPSSATWQS